ncbi:MAG: F0F1 ATP synthase subunit epsilon [Campylobacterales bacterium]|nr:F0F1 ATP synthase subunit epsilon [Campylobacterales bacterium]
MELMKLEVVTPMGVIYDDDVKQVTFPGAEGEFGVLPQHASLVSLLHTGLIDIEEADSSRVSVAIDSGYVKIDENKAVCLVEGAVALDSDDKNIAKAIERAEALVKSVENSNAAIATASKLSSMKKSI